MEDKANFDLSGKVALVTGAGRGLGHAIALALAHAGADVVLGLRDVKSDGGLVKQITALGRRALAVQMDVTNRAQADRAVDEALASTSGIDILVNNAGNGVGDMAIDAKEADFDFTIDINVKASFFLSQKVARHMIDRKKGGRIVNISSQAAIVALPGESIYCIAKAAMSHMTRCLAVEWGKYDIGVNAIAPTFFETPGTSEALSDPAFKADTLERIAALHRIGKPVEAAAAVVFLASPAASMITGHNLVIDGGWTIR